MGEYTRTSFKFWLLAKRFMIKTLLCIFKILILLVKKTVKLLGIEIDYQLNFDVHVSSICRKASRQLNVLKSNIDFHFWLKQISFINTLNNKGSSIEPCGTPLWMSAQPLRTLLTFICCFRFDKEIDYQLNFDVHVSSICRKASQQLNVLKRLGSLLNRLSKLTIFQIA
jgi:hypothetical protein